MGLGFVFVFVVSLIYPQTLALVLAHGRCSLQFLYWTFPVEVHMHLLSYIPSEHIISLSLPHLAPQAWSPSCVQSSQGAAATGSAPAQCQKLCHCSPSLFSVPQPLQSFCSLTMARLFHVRVFAFIVLSARNVPPPDLPMISSSSSVRALLSDTS